MQHGIDVIVAKNSGGTATYGKIAAARTLGIEVIMFAPAGAAGRAVRLQPSMRLCAMVDHVLDPAEKRGV